MIVWSTCHQGRFSLAEWDDDDTVVYDIASGDTHVVDSLATELLHLLRQGPELSTESLMADLHDVFDAEPDAEIAARIEHSLARLRDIGLVADHLR